MPIIELSTALVAAGSGLVVPFANKVLEKSAQRLGGHIDEQLAALFTRAHGYLTATGREAQSVEPHLLKPIVENAPLETDPALAAHWAALLANAADPARQSYVQPAFAEILRQLTALDARILQTIATISQGQEAGTRPYMYAEATRIQREAGEGDGLLTIAFRIAVDNLLRLRLCDGRGTTRPPGKLSELISGRHSDTLAEGPGKDRLAITDLGLAFLDAVTPPTS